MVDTDGGVEGLSVCNGWWWHGSWLLSHGIGMLLEVSSAWTGTDVWCLTRDAGRGNDDSGVA